MTPWRWKNPEPLGTPETPRARVPPAFRSLVMSPLKRRVSATVNRGRGQEGGAGAPHGSGPPNKGMAQAEAKAENVQEQPEIWAAEYLQAWGRSSAYIERLKSPHPTPPQPRLPAGSWRHAGQARSWGCLTCRCG